MHSDSTAVKKSIRTYMLVGAALLVFTGITVAANLFHLAVPVAVTLALIIATVKGSMVASIFMHLSHEKKWIYGALILTVVGFLILMTVPIFTTMDTIGQHVPAIGGAPGRGAVGALNMSLRAFHLFFIGISVVLAAFFAAWAAGQYSAGNQPIYIVVAVLSLCGAAGLAVYTAKFQRKTKGLTS